MRMSAIVWICSVLLLMGLLAWMGVGLIPKAPPSQAQSSGTALIGGDFQLTDSTGKIYTPADFKGRYMLVYFGFTHCPDICPTSLLLIDTVLEDMGSKGDAIVPVFITLDPERDTPKIVGDYVKHFGPRLVGLTGTPEQIRQAAEAYKVYYRKVEDKSSGLGYMIDHSGYFYLMGPDGKYLTHFSHGVSESALQEGLAKFVR